MLALLSCDWDNCNTITSFFWFMLACFNQKYVARLIILNTLSLTDVFYDAVLVVELHAFGYT